MNKINKNKGFSLIEITVSLFIITATFLGLYQIFISSISSLTKSEINSRAYFLAQDAMEAVKNIRDRKWDEIENLTLSTSEEENPYYPVHQEEDGEWQLTSGTETIDNYTRSIIFENVLRDVDGDIVEESGTSDPLMKKVTVRVSWGAETQAEELSLEFTGGTTVYDLANFPATSGWGDPGQSFTTGEDSVTVPKVSLYLGKGISNPSNIYLEIRSGSMTGTILGTSNTITSADLPSGSLAWQDFTFSSSVELSASTQYFLRLRSIPDSTIPGSGAEGPIYWGYLHSVSGYAGGEAWRHTTSILDQYDFSFKIYESSSAGQSNEIKLTNYITNWDYMNSFVSYFTQTNKSDYTANSNTNTDINIQPGNVLLARESLYEEFFHDFEEGEDPLYWYDTNNNYSLNPADYFETFEVGGEIVYGETQNQSNIHSHYNRVDGEVDAYAWDSYEVSGRMMFTKENAGGMGITFFSRYRPEGEGGEAKYYRLMSEPGNNDCSHTSEGNFRSFCIEAYGAEITAEGVDDRDTEVVPYENIWYRFRIQVKNVNDQALIVAKVWEDGTTEPDSWQVDCHDSDNYISSGTIGFWVTSGGRDYYFDDIVVRNLGDYFSPGTMESIVLDTGTTSNFGEISWSADVPEYTTLQLQIRTAATAILIDDAPWCGPDSCEPVDDYYQTDSTGEVINPVHDGDRFIQYRAILTTTDTDLSPVLREVNISYGEL